MAVRWSRWSPQIALTPAVAVTAVAFAGSIGWTIWMSLTRSRRFADYTINWDEWARQYSRLLKDDIFITALKNMVILGVGSLLAIVFGFILAAMIDREKRGEGIFRTVFLYPLAVSLIVTGLAWRWLFNPAMGVQKFFADIGLPWIHFDWLNYPQTAMYGIILGTVWQGSGFYMALMLSGLKSINSEIWSAAKLDGVSFWRLYIEIIIPMMKFTFLTCAILLSLGVVKAYDMVYAMTNGGPGQSTWVPAYYTIDAYWQKQNLGLASAAAVVMLLITVAIFLPLVLLTGWQQRRQEARVQ
ncbi:MAG TPA: sugar ABC transporter permease [Devosiaceae bacterium]|jgi:glucose/mannose transport system permease protein|nr:sugar ABC transporter permease [Devosiaceae bacterium]